MKRFLCRVGLLLIVSSTVATAQPARTRSLDLSIGGGGLMGGTPRTYRSTVGGAIDAMFSAPVGRAYRVGVSWSAQAGLQNTDDCIVRDPDSGCLTRLPLVTSWSVLAGRDWQLSPSLALRASAGPSLVSVYRRTSNPYYWSSMGGVSGRLDVILPGRANLVASLRGAIVPALPNASGTLAFGIGMGLH
jgi:hypothetical protein